MDGYYYGWISCERKERATLESIGVQVGKYDGTRFLNCTMTPDAYEQLSELPFNRFISLLDYVQDGGIQ